jgi:hypothetical protein
MYWLDIHVQVQVSSNIDGHGFHTHLEAMPIPTHLETIPTHAHPWRIISNPCPHKTHGHKWVWAWVWAPNVGLWFRVTSHTSQEPWPWNCESPKESVQRLSQDTSKLMYCGHRSPSVVWSHMWASPQPNALSMNFYSYGFSYMIL